MFPPSLGRSTIGVRQYRRATKRRKKRARRLGLTAKRHALRLSPVRHSKSQSTPSLHSTSKPITMPSDRSNRPKDDDSHIIPTESMLTRSEARARLFGMKRRIVDRLLQKKASETGNKERQDTRLLILAYRDMDENGDGSIDYEEFHKALGPEGLNCGLAPPEISDLFTALDMDGSGDVSMQEFLDELMIADKPPAELMIDRGRRLTLDWMERKLKKHHLDHQQDHQTHEDHEDHQAHQAHQAHQDQQNQQDQQNEERNRNERNSYELQASSSFRRSGTASGRLYKVPGEKGEQRRQALKQVWEHPLHSKRPSTSNSEYGNLPLGQMAHSREMPMVPLM